MAVEKLRFEFDGDASKFQSAVNKSQKSVNNFSTSLKQVGGIIAGAFAVDKLLEFGSAIIDTTSEFERFEAVLTNTLGSKSQAQKALNDITEFASKTPFSVVELTDSFVRLANQGFRPTRNEMRKLGDLASSTGKQFDQLAEAVIDAQVGEFERLKEFGIRASKQGDQVTFTFKGVQKQVEFSSQAIQDYVLSLGDVEGVSGAMASISETLGGQISNLGDSFDMLKKVLGEQLKPALSSVIGLMGDLLTKTTEFIQRGGIQDFFAKIVGAVNPVVGTMQKVNGITIRTVDDVKKKIAEQTVITNESTKANDEATKTIDLYANAVQNLGTQTQQTNEILTQITPISELINQGLSNVRQKIIDTTDTTFDFAQEMKSGFESIALAVGSSLVSMAFQADKSVMEIINSLAKMILQMTIALAVATALRAVMGDATAIANVGKAIGATLAIVAGAGIIAGATSNRRGVQKFAHGGIVTKPTMGIVGEAGQSEAIIPLNRLPQLMGTMGSNQRGEFTLRGQDLILALERAGDFRTRVTG